MTLIRWFINISSYKRKPSLLETGGKNRNRINGDSKITKESVSPLIWPLYGTAPDEVMVVIM